MIGTSDNIAVDPRFVEFDQPVTPRERLQTAACRVARTTTEANRNYDEFVAAMIEHPYVEQVFNARYGKQLSEQDRYRSHAGLAVFRHHYQTGVLMTTSADMLPVIGCALEMDQIHAMEKILVNDPDLRRQVDKDVMTAVRGF